MINVYYTYEPKEKKHELNIVGHADYSNNGNDIVCAGVSAIAYCLLGMLENCEDSINDIDTIDHSGDLSIYCKGEKEVDTAFKMAVIGLMQISKKYPSHVYVDC